MPISGWCHCTATIGSLTMTIISIVFPSSDTYCSLLELGLDVLSIMVRILSLSIITDKVLSSSCTYVSSSDHLLKAFKDKHLGLVDTPLTERTVLKKGKPSLVSLSWCYSLTHSQPFTWLSPSAFLARLMCCDDQCKQAPVPPCHKSMTLCSRKAWCVSIQNSF